MVCQKYKCALLSLRISARYFFPVCILALCFINACDPCYRLAELVCECKDSEEERKACKDYLSLGKSHKHFEAARDRNVCLRALEECSCKDILEGNDERCGMYRIIGDRL